MCAVTPAQLDKWEGTQCCFRFLTTWLPALFRLPRLLPSTLSTTNRALATDPTRPAHLPPAHLPPAHLPPRQDSQHLLNIAAHPRSDLSSTLSLSPPHTLSLDPISTSLDFPVPLPPLGIIALTLPMACPFCRFGAWLRRRLKSSSQSSRSRPPPPLRDTSHDRIPLCSYIERHESPPPYQVLPQTTSSGSEDLDNLRAENPPCSFPGDLGPNMPPPPRETRNETMQAAMITATNGLRRALAEQEPAMVAARAVQGIALAVSTSRSYSACVAATTAAEFQALRCADILRRRDCVFDPCPHRRYGDVARVVTDVINASDATAYDAPYGWPWYSDDEDEMHSSASWTHDDDEVPSSASSTHKTSSTSSSSGPPSQPPS